MNSTIICYGDSNTYGYDPRLGGGGRFPEEARWTGILKKKLSNDSGQVEALAAETVKLGKASHDLAIFHAKHCQIATVQIGSEQTKSNCRLENYGACGRSVPRTEWEISAICEEIEMFWNEETPVWMWIMLGTNDLLQEQDTTAFDVAARMTYFLEKLTETAICREGKLKLLLIAPPAMKPGTWVTEERLLRESRKLGEEYRTVAEALEIAFADAGEWEIPLVFDGVHFSEEGHRMFAAHMEHVARFF